MMRRVHIKFLLILVGLTCSFPSWAEGSKQSNKVSDEQSLEEQAERDLEKELRYAKKNADRDSELFREVGREILESTSRTFEQIIAEQEKQLKQLQQACEERHQPKTFFSFMKKLLDKWTTEKTKLLLKDEVLVLKLAEDLLAENKDASTQDSLDAYRKKLSASIVARAKVLYAPQKSGDVSNAAVKFMLDQIEERIRKNQNVGLLILGLKQLFDEVDVARACANAAADVHK